MPHPKRLRQRREPYDMPISIRFRSSDREQIDAALDPDQSIGDFVRRAAIAQARRVITSRERGQNETAA